MPLEPRQAYIGLNMIGLLGPVRVRALIEALGSPEAVFSAAVTELEGVPGIGGKLARHIAARREAVDPAAEEDRARALRAWIITPLDPEYPPALKAIHDPPLALYGRGALEPRDQHAIAIVGSRHCTYYGKSAADLFAFQLAQAGYTVVSGLARGIDTAAHQGALKARGRTLAVLGGALDKLYPPENEALAEQTPAGQGAVLSEYVLGREPDRTTFPYRNRVISGLSRGVLVAEAPLRSGALQTTSAAADQNRQVFAVPGRIDHPASAGCHRLIQDGAKLVTCLDDILEEFDALWARTERQPAAAGDRKRPDENLSPAEAALVQALGAEEQDVDELIRASGLNAGQVNTALTLLQMKAIVHTLPGGRFGLAVRRGDLA
ncbi:MAG: DNA-processing protein DprA [Candidatus Marinimicrobia bacterium]|nr:DNA-processing protein DprA [Candidatus Neomarinimicrobiota bacterium]